MIARVKGKPKGKPLFFSLRNAKNCADKNIKSYNLHSFIYIYIYLYIFI